MSKKAISFLDKWTCKEANYVQRWQTFPI